MICLIYRVDLELGLRYSEGTLLQHTGMSQWLRKFGDRNFVYEVWKSQILHSRWVWKIDKKKWLKLVSISHN